MPLSPDLRRTWLFGSASDRIAHLAMRDSGADLLIADLEDFTPPPKREKARELLPALLADWRGAGRVTAVRINQLDTEGPQDLAAAMRGQPDVIAYPMASTAAQMRDLDRAITTWEDTLGIAPGRTEMLPVCETALGVADVRAIAAGSPRIRAALMGTEDLANDLCAERSRDATELEHARSRFLLDCRAAGIEPVDAPYTFSDVEGAVRETAQSRRLGYRCKGLVRPDHAAAINAALTPTEQDVARARALVEAFDAARARGEERVLLDGLWVEVPTYRSARRVLERAKALARRT